jgi:hypothetical protein
MALPFSSTALTITAPSLVLFYKRASRFFQEDSPEQVPVHSTRERRGFVFFFKNRTGMPFVAPGCHPSLSL